ncbi:transcriptional repressor [Candidatus Woesearchaeota archaeon]|nr:transcriptional repressor [Nanoarchaeota archaeon]MCB9370429.1 transcriptional repressor [Candidatus Woesearchaeota archaeon]USN43507.1 MAG: transcriptional repressor [Candidatus Woesearchaeota archaeon]
MKSRQTRQKEVIEEEIRKTKTFFNAEALLEKVAKVDKKIGIATIYRFLKDARERNQIYSYTCQGKTIYSSTKRSHCHFECTETGKIVHFELENLDFLKDKVPGEIESFQLEVKGVFQDK